MRHKGKQKTDPSGLKLIAVSPWVYQDLQKLGFTSDSFNTIVKRMIFYLDNKKVTREDLKKLERK